MAHDGLAHGQQVNPNKLPLCPPPDMSKTSDFGRFAKWHNCWGGYKFVVESDRIGDLVEGEWSNGLPNGFAKYESRSGNKYVGEFRNGKMHGQGKYTDTDGYIYVGQYKDGNYNGFGTEILFSAKYVGEFKDNEKHGQGIFEYLDGRRQEGIFEKDKFLKYVKVDHPRLKKYKSENPDRSDIEYLQFVEDSKKDEIKSLNSKKLPLCPKADFSSPRPKEKWVNCWGREKFYLSENQKFQWDGEYRNGGFNGMVIHFVETELGVSKYIGEFKDGRRYGYGYGIDIDKEGSVYEGEFFSGKFHGEGRYKKLDGKIYEGIWDNGNFLKEANIKIKSVDRVFALTTRNSKPNIAQFKTIKEDYLFSKNEPNDRNETQRLNIRVNNTQPKEDGVISILVQTNADTASLKINGEEQGGRADGNYSIKRVARVGQDTQFTITAVDVYGNSDTKTITVTRQAAPAADTSIALKPEAIKRAPARDAVAIIIGIQDYKRVPKAEFANNDAKEFYEYAIRALGIKQEKIKMLLDDEADEVNIVKAFENWLPIQVNKDKTDVYVFYSGHGLPAPDGKSLYFLPHGVAKELLSRTAVGQNEIVAALSAVKPKSVTMFIDACYSGQTRGGDVLVANAKPVSLKSDTNAYPPNFTVITASANDQISSSSPELKHGIFSFYLMKGMEGEADANKDGKITVGEMQDYLSDKVSRQAMTLNRKQTTQLVGDAGRVLITR